MERANSTLVWKLVATAVAAVGGLLMLLIGANVWWLQREVMKNSDGRDLSIRLDTKMDMVLARLTAVEGALARRAHFGVSPPRKPEVQKIQELKSGFQYSWNTQKP